jgi:KUP system potassium uptake protein
MESRTSRRSSRGSGATACGRAGDVVYVLGRETILATERRGMALWRERLFAFLARNAARATAFFNLPPRQVIEIGAEIDL